MMGYANQDDEYDQREERIMDQFGEAEDLDEVEDEERDGALGSFRDIRGVPNVGYGLQEDSAEDEEVLEKPKRPKSAYFLFLDTRRAKCRADNPGLKMTDRQKIMSKEWNCLDAESKKEFEIAAQEAKEEYKKKMVRYREWLAKQDMGRKYERNPHQKAMDRPKRPRSAFLFFLNHERPACRAEHPEAKIGQVTKILSKSWRQLSVEDKRQFDEQAARDKERYKRESAKFEKYLSNLTYAPTSVENISSDPTELILPLAKVKKVIYLDKSINSRISKEALWLIAKSAEAFIENFACKVKQYAARSGRKTVLAKDFNTPLRQHEALSFLREPFKVFIKNMNLKQARMNGQLNGSSSSSSRKRKPDQSHGQVDDSRFKTQKITSMFAQHDD